MTSESARAEALNTRALCLSARERLIRGAAAAERAGEDPAQMLDALEDIKRADAKLATVVGMKRGGR